MLAPRADGNLSRIDAVEKNCSPARLHETQEDIRNRRFPRARRSDDSRKTAFRKSETYAREDLPALGIRKRDIFEREPALKHKLFIPAKGLLVGARLIDMRERFGDIRDHDRDGVELHLARLYLRENLIHRIHDHPERRYGKTGATIHDNEDESDKNDSRELYKHLDIAPQNNRPQIKAPHFIEKHIRSRDDGLFEGHRFERFHADYVFTDEMRHPPVGTLAIDSYKTHAVKNRLQAEENKSACNEAERGNPYGHIHRDQDIHENLTHDKRGGRDVPEQLRCI